MDSVGAADEDQKLREELRQSFEDLGNCVRTYDPLSLLSQLTLTYLSVPEDKFQSEASDVVTWQRRIEFLTAFVLVRPYPPAPTEAVDGRVLEQIENLLERYFSAVERLRFCDDVRGLPRSEEASILVRAKIESFYVRGDMYPHQFFDFALGLYGPHDVWFREHLGFTISEAVKLSEVIERAGNERINRSLEQARTEAHRKAEELISANQVGNDQRSQLASSIFCALHFGTADDVLSFTADEITRSSGFPTKVSECFLKRMSQEFGHRNPAFPNTFTEAANAPWDYNTLNERPIVRRESKYWLFIPPLLQSSLFATFYFDLLSDREYWPTFEKARGKFLEQKTADCLRRVFPENMTLLNPEYSNGEELADVMVLHDHKILLFQCKSKGLTHRAKIGADFETLRDDVRKSTADAFQQAARARDYLKANSRSEFTFNGGKFLVEMDQVNGIYLVSVTATSFRALSGRLGNTNSVLELFPQNEYPWSLSLGDLDIVTQVLSSPAQFIHYLLRRQEIEKTSFHIHADEMEYLGFYLLNGMRFDSGDVHGLDHVGLSGMSGDIDKWVYEKFDHGINIAPPRRAAVAGFSDFVAEIEQTGNDYATDCALALLDLSRRAEKEFMEMVGQTKERSRQDNALHSFSALPKGSSRGLSFVSFDARGDRLEIYRQVVSFALLKKYQSKLEEWVGFGWDVSSNRSVDVTFFVSQPWEYDAEVERLVSDKLNPGNRAEI